MGMSEALILEDSALQRGAGGLEEELRRFEEELSSLLG